MKRPSHATRPLQLGPSGPAAEHSSDTVYKDRQSVAVSVVVSRARAWRTSRLRERRDADARWAVRSNTPNLKRFQSFFLASLAATVDVVVWVVDFRFGGTGHAWSKA